MSLILTLFPTCMHLVRAEAHVAKLQDRGEDGPDGGDLISMQTDGFKALNQKLEVLLVLFPLQFTGTTLDRDSENVSVLHVWWMKRKRKLPKSQSLRIIQCSLRFEGPGLGSNRSQLLADKAPACPSHSYRPATHRTHGSFSPYWPTRQIRTNSPVT